MEQPRSRAVAACLRPRPGPAAHACAQPVLPNKPERPEKAEKAEKAVKGPVAEPLWKNAFARMQLVQTF